MSTNHTVNYQLSQWEATDPVLREDFNADNRKIEKALRERNILAIDHIYEGDGEDGVGLNPYRRNLMVFLVGDSHSLLMVRPATTAVCYSATGEAALVNVTWSEMGVTWTSANSDPAMICNKSGAKYACIQVLSIE